MVLIKDVHIGFPFEFNDDNSRFAFIRGSYDYFHYLCDGFDDRGWGCGYRTLQTICSWIKEQQKYSNLDEICEVPTIDNIQRALVAIGDKSAAHINSKEWIGSVEVAYVIEYFYKVQCRIIHSKCIEDLRNQTEDIFKHFKEYGSPIMMGGDMDCSSKGILGICEAKDEVYLLILDPHFTGGAVSKEMLQQDGWIKWEKLEDLDHHSFYNLCCPLVKAAHS